jgi:hypothetical protein
MMENTPVGGHGFSRRQKPKNWYESICPFRPFLRNMVLWEDLIHLCIQEINHLISYRCKILFMGCCYFCIQSSFEDRHAEWSHFFLDFREDIIFAATVNVTDMIEVFLCCVTVQVCRLVGQVRYWRECIQILKCTLLWEIPHIFSS